MSLENCFLYAYWIELVTIFLLLQSNTRNMYWKLEAKLWSQNFSLASTNFKCAIGLSPYLLKLFPPVEYSLRNPSASQLSSKVKETEVWLSPVAVLTISLNHILDLLMIAEKDKKDLFSFLSFSSSLPSTSSALPAWSSIFDSLSFLLIRRFYNSESDCSLTFSQPLSIIMLL